MKQERQRCSLAQCKDTVGWDLMDPRLLPEEQGICAPYQAPQSFGLAPERKGPKNVKLWKSMEVYNKENWGAKGI